MAKSTEKYECMYILNPNLTEEETSLLVEGIRQRGEKVTALLNQLIADSEKIM